MSRAYISVELRRQIRLDAAARCGYCHTSEEFVGMPLEIEHIVPEAVGGQTVRENLWLACTRCNDFKGDRIQAPDPQGEGPVSLFNPRTHIWTEHFSWTPDGLYIRGRTPIGRATVEMLRCNNEFILIARRFWVESGRWPPADDISPTG